jgi:Regulatory subunit of type II PKA R-subunit
MPVSEARTGSGMNFDIPAGLTELLQEFTVAVLRSRPGDLYQFAADYFSGINDRRNTKETTAKERQSANDQQSVPLITTTLSHQESSEDEPAGKTMNLINPLVYRSSFLTE